jgi:cytoskeletal protein CcmA (bactofilin family)
MFGEKGEAIKLAESSREISTVLDKECTFEGKMTFEGCVVIHGKFKGEIFSEGSLIIGEGGYVEGHIEIGNIQIQGEVRGNISASQKIEINAPAVVQGDIAAPSLIIKEGAVFEGNCAMGRKVKGNVVDLSSGQSG